MLAPLAQTPPVTLTEEELREHLPTNLLDDLEGMTVTEGGTRPAVHPDHDEPKKKSWFSLGRRRRSLSAASAAEASFAELKAGSKLSLSDRLPYRSRHTEDDSHDSGFGPDGAPSPRSFSAERQPPLDPPPPPGF